MGVMDFILKGLGFEEENSFQRDEGKRTKKNVRNKPIPTLSEPNLKWAELESNLLKTSSCTGALTIDKLGQAQGKKVAVLEPCTFNDVRVAIEFLQTKQPALINLNLLDDDIKQRGIDFFAGGVFALRGQLEPVSSGMYMFAPEGVALYVPAKIRQELTSGIIISGT